MPGWRFMNTDLVDLIHTLGTPRLLVVGDLILDRYVWGDAERISQEAPVILLREDRQELRLGGASNVARMIRGLEAEVVLAGVTGADEDGCAVRRELETAGIDSSLVFSDASRPTTVKVRFMGRAQHRHPHQMLRVDREVRTPISSELADAFAQKMISSLGGIDAILISDYAKGVCTPQLIQQLISAARSRGIPILADPAAGADYSRYRGATGVTPNRSETTQASGIAVNSIDAALQAGRNLVERFDLEMAFVTIDRDGIVLVPRNGAGVHLPTRPREVYDITGAGDMVLAMIGVGIAAGISPDDLGRLANIAGGLEVEQVGVVPISRREILADLLRGPRLSRNKILPRASLVSQISARRAAGQKIVMTNGCFDLLHAGHVSYLQEAAREGDCLVVAVNSDESIRGLGKGADRPLFHEEYRATMLAALEAVDYVVVFEEATPHALIEAIRPDVLVKGGTYRADEIVGREIVLGYGGQVKPMGIAPGLSTTDIVRRLKGEFPRQAIPFGLPSRPENEDGHQADSQREAA